MHQRSVFTVGNICDEIASGSKLKQCQTLILTVSGSTHQADRRLTDVYTNPAEDSVLTPAVCRNGRPTQSMISY